MAVLKSMFAAFVLLSLAQVPVGAFGMPELCKVLTTATGVPHTVDVTLVDYPVFVSVKSGDPARVRQLVAAALHGEWVETNGRFRLKALKPGKNSDFAEFERLYREACKGYPIYQQLPIRELYQMAPGEIVRYGPDPGPNIRPFPPEIAGLTDAPKTPILVRRMAPGVFERGFSIGETDFNGMSDAVKAVLKGDLTTKPLTPEQKAKIAKFMDSSEVHRVEWSQFNQRDPIAVLQELVLKPVGEAVTADLVVALPDFSIFALMDHSEGDQSVQSILAKYSICVSWIAVDGAAVGSLTQCELDNPSQPKRSVLESFIDAVGKDGVANVEELADYMSHQRPASSDSWTDAMMLAYAGAVMDEDFVGDYPYNIRLYTDLDKDDWTAIRSGQAFPVSELSASARKELLNLLLQSRSRLIVDNAPDPALWKTLEPSQLTVKASIADSPVLIGFTGGGGEISSVEHSAMSYDMRRRHLDHDPLYQPATRRKLTLTISSPIPGQTVTTGFSEVTKGNTKAVVWKNLPPDIAAEFKTALEHMRRLEHPPQQTKVPPPL